MTAIARMRGSKSSYTTLPPQSATARACGPMPQNPGAQLCLRAFSIEHGATSVGTVLTPGFLPFTVVFDIFGGFGVLLRSTRTTGLPDASSRDWLQIVFRTSRRIRCGVPPENLDQREIVEVGRALFHHPGRAERHPLPGFRGTRFLQNAGPAGGRDSGPASPTRSPAALRQAATIDQRRSGDAHPGNRRSSSG